MNTTPRALALSVLLLAGCETTERIKPKNSGESGVKLENTGDPGDEKTTRDEALLKYLEEHPEDAAAWWRLGTYYEKVSRYPEAVNAYQKLAALCEEAARRDKIPYTAGLYHLGVCLAKARQYAPAVEHLRDVLKLKPSDDREASLNKHFRESHYWLGAIYYEHRQWQLAKEHFLAFKRVGGPDERVDPWLLRIEEFEGDALIRRQGTPPPTDPRRAPRGGKPKPAADKPAADKPAADKPAADKPTADTPTADTPAADTPAADTPAADKPAADKPAADTPADKPAADKPAAGTAAPRGH